MSERYVVKEGSESFHCCFESTVVDTTNDNLVCECLEEGYAELICDALNAMKGEPMMKRLPELSHLILLATRDEIATLANELPTEGDIVLWQLAYKIVDAIDELLRENRKRIEAGG